MEVKIEDAYQKQIPLSSLLKGQAFLYGDEPCIFVDLHHALFNIDDQEDSPEYFSIILVNEKNGLEVTRLDHEKFKNMMVQIIEIKSIVFGR